MQKSRYGLLLVVLMISALHLGACARKTVQIPQDWQSPPPQTRESAPGPQSFKAPAQSFEAGKSAVLKPPPTISEKDLSSGTPQPPAPSPTEKKPAAQPQRLASMHLVDQAKAALAKGKPDQAIPLLEQAIQVDVYNGEAFFQLARAWRMKKSRGKAIEFSRKAEILFQDQPGRLKEVYLLQAELYKEAGDTKKSQAYQQKAQKLR